MAEALKETDILLHAYVLMTNCVHLLLTPKRAAEVPKLMILLGRHCAQYFNSTCGRRGALWNSRYKSSLIQAETYLLRCVRYFELNPVRPGMIGDPAYCRWSRFRCNALGQNSSPSTPHPVHAALGRSGEARCAAYRQRFRHHLEEAAVDDLRLALNQRQPLGDSRFYAKIERMVGQRRQARPRGRPAAPGMGAGKGRRAAAPAGALSLPVGGADNASLAPFLDLWVKVSVVGEGGERGERCR